jgi:hypothetical protein
MSQPDNPAVLYIKMLLIVVIIKRNLVVIETHFASQKLKRLVAGFPPRRLDFDPRSGNMGFLVDKETLAGFLGVLRFPLPILIPSNAPYLSSGAGTIVQEKKM